VEQTVQTESEEVNARYARWVELCGGGPNHKYMAWISKHAVGCRKRMGLHQRAPIPRDVFDSYLLGMHECPVCGGEGERRGHGWGDGPEIAADCVVCEGTGEVDVDAAHHFAGSHP